MNARRRAEHEVSITKTLRGFHFVKVVGATPWLCQWHGLQDMTEASSFHQLRLQVDSLGHVYMVASNWSRICDAVTHAYDCTHACTHVCTHACTHRFWTSSQIRLQFEGSWNLRLQYGERRVAYNMLHLLQGALLESMFSAHSARKKTSGHRKGLPSYASA